MVADPMMVLIFSAFASFLGSLVVLRSQLGRDPLAIGGTDPQHVHAGHIPRAGGAALGAAALIGAVLVDALMPGTIEMHWLVLLSAAPVLGVGLAEDLIGDVRPFWRYGASLLAAILLYAVVDAHLARLDVALFDAALAWQPLMALVTVFCLAGVTQAFNIIDGKNGLAAGMAFIALSAMGLVAHEFGDAPVAAVAIIGAGIALGFLILNYPRGLLFLGDGGAYFLGFLVAAVAVVIVQRHDALSAWFPLMVAAYPILETLVSFARRLLIERQGFHEPDHLHMHSLLFQRLSRVFQDNPHWQGWPVNALTAAVILGASTVVAVLAYQYRFDSGALQLLAAITVLVYFGSYLLLRLAAGRQLSH